MIDDALHHQCPSQRDQVDWKTELQQPEGWKTGRRVNPNPPAMKIHAMLYGKARSRCRYQKRRFCRDPKIQRQEDW